MGRAKKKFSNLAENGTNRPDDIKSGLNLVSDRKVCVVRKREVRLQAFSYASPLTLYALNKCSSCLVVEVCKRTSTYDLGSQPAAFVTDCVLAGAG